MPKLSSPLKSFSKMLDPKHLVKNTYLFSVLSIFLAIYGPRLHMRLPDSLRNLFDHMVFRCAILFLIIYLSSRNFQSSIVISVIFLVTMNILHTTRIFESFQEQFTVINGPPVAACNTYKSDDINEVGTAAYPLNPDDDEENPEQF